MPTKTFEGKDQTDLDKQIWDWKSLNPKVKELKRHPVERLPLHKLDLHVPWTLESEKDPKEWPIIGQSDVAESC